MSSVAQRIQELGLDLNHEALQALGGLPLEHALDLLDQVERKKQSSGLTNPSNYVCATIAKGFVPTALRKPDLIGLDVASPSDPTAAVAAAAAAGLQLTSEAVDALSGMVPEHAAELLEFVAAKKDTFRDPSNYILATIARGFQSRRQRQGATQESINELAQKIGGDVDPKCFILAQEVGSQLSDEAVKKLATLPPDHAMEMLEFVGSKIGEIRDPSVYILSTILRGFQSRKERQSASPSSVISLLENVAVPSADARSIRIAQEMGLELSDEAVRKLATIPPQDASELLEFLAAKRGEIRDPSVYVISTVARGFQSRKRSAGAAGLLPMPSTDVTSFDTTLAAITAAAASPNPLAALSVSASSAIPQAAPSWSTQAALASTNIWPAMANPAPGADLATTLPAMLQTALPPRSPAHGLPPAANQTLLPRDVSVVEQKVVDLNSGDIFNGQQLDIETLLALRCLPTGTALELLQQVEAKFRSGSGVGISSLNSYIQAVISKLVKQKKLAGASSSQPLQQFEGISGSQTPQQLAGEGDSNSQAPVQFSGSTNGSQLSHQLAPEQQPAAQTPQQVAGSLCGALDVTGLLDLANILTSAVAQSGANGKTF